MRERLIGATVLVVAAVILIPWLVSRAHHPREQVRTLPLPAASTAAAPSVLPLPPAEKHESDATSPSAAQTAGSAAASPATAHSRIPSSAVPKSTASGSNQRGSAAVVGSWYVQVASFTSSDDAQKLAGKLSKAGFHAGVSPHAVRGKIWYRVRVGPYEDAASARSAATGIAKVSGTKVLVRKNDGRDG